MFVYVISESPAGPCKIGFASNTYKRLASLQSGNHRRFKLEFSQATDHPRVLERVAHALAIRSLIAREWFDLTPVRAIEIVKQALEDLPRLMEEDGPLTDVSIVDQSRIDNMEDIKLENKRKMLNRLAIMRDNRD